MSLDFNFTVTSSFLRNVRIKPYFPFIAGGSCSKLWWIVYSEKATKFCKIFTLLLSYVVPVKSKVKISQNFVAFSEYMNFNKDDNIY